MLNKSKLHQMSNTELENTAENLVCQWNLDAEYYIELVNEELENRELEKIKL